MVGLRWLCQVVAETLPYALGQAEWHQVVVLQSQLQLQMAVLTVVALKLPQDLPMTEVLAA
jgi:hypothetical protein